MEEFNVVKLQRLTRTVAYRGLKSMEKALKLIDEKNVPIKIAAQVTGVDRFAITRAKKAIEGGREVEEEQQLVAIVKENIKKKTPLTYKQFKNTCRDVFLLDRDKNIAVGVPKFSVSFRRRFIEAYDFSTKKARPMDMKRFLSGNIVTEFLDKVEKILTEHNMSPCLIYNMDETMLELGTNHTRVISIIDAPRAFVPTTPTSDHTTLALCVNAAGDYVKPLCILPLKELPRLHPITESVFSLSGQPNGSITKQLFESWVVGSFLPHVAETRAVLGTPDAWALLLVDGHNS